MTDGIIFGHNTDSRIVAVYQTSDTTVKIVRRIDGKTTTQERKFYPFLFLKDAALLRGFDKKFWEVKLAGTNYYQYLCIFRRWSDIRAALRKITENLSVSQGGTSQDLSETDEVYVRQDPVFQFLMQTGMTLFKEMEFTELTRMQLDIETFARSGFSNASRKEDRIILISLSDSTGWEYVVDGREKSETEMLNELVNIIRERDPDVIEGHNIYNFDLPYLMRRAEMNGVKFRIGRDDLEPRVFTSRLSYAEREIEYSNVEIPGRQIIDTWLLVQSYDSTRRELESYGLKNAAKFFGFASEDRTYIEGSKISETWLKNPELLVKYALDDVRETRLLAEYLSQTSFYLSQVLPFSYGQIPRTGSAVKIESLFVREYLRKKHSIPRPQTGRQTSGGYTDVFLRGVVGPIVHADVESLYPSIMITYKISPEGDALGVFQRTLKHLTKLRLDTKKQMKAETDPPAKFKLDAMQSSLKILINSFYGYLGYSRGIFNDYSAADVVTETGQKILRQMISQISSAGGKVLEVDTDGLYFVPPPECADEEAENKFVAGISHSLPQGINLSLDGRFRRMLSYKKKNYALLGYDNKVRIRGSALISRSMEKFGREFIHTAIEFMLNENIQGLHELYVEYVRKIGRREIQLSKMVRTESVKESVDEYLSAVRANRRNRTASYEAAISAGIDLRPGDRVSYYISGNEPTPRSFMNARLFDEDNPDQPEYNSNYYLRKLGEYAQRFQEFFSPADFRKVFSSDEDMLFKISVEGVKMKSEDVSTAESKIEEEQEE
ncbi:MAG: DNA polymerase [Bacteroidetes bacterium]|jgi:DNA polymerase elongation subunit (family B)|nr:DNA polymerase [Bacteroidota bacterium]MCL5034306.1 DNA polymerase [Bacteroidota bacterium]